MECVIKDQLVSYLLRNGLISKQQHAFLTKRSTISNLLECIHDWTLSLQNKLAIDTIYIDFSHAFDGVVHSKLLRKLSGFGISGLLLQWIDAFLSNRIQSVVLEHSFSVWSPVISGVPQGSVLGPILFLLFIEDISIICSGEVSHQLFADDLKLYTSLTSNSDVFSLQAALDKLHNWCTAWQFDVNVSKCHVLHIGKTNFSYDYRFNGAIIPPSVEVVDLGVTVDTLLTYDAHINHIISKAYSRIGAMFKGFSTRSLSFLKKAFVTYVRPIVEYASNVWNPYLLKHINAIERVQRRFSKRIPSLKDLSYSERLAVLDLEPLELRRLKADLVLYFKIFHNLVHLPREYLPDAPPAPQVSTRSTVNRLSFINFATYQLDNNFFNRCVVCWNYLPESVVAAQSVAVFKHNLSTVDLSAFLHGNYY